MFDPPVVWDVVSRRFCMKVDHSVVAGVCHWSQFTNEVEDSLIQIELCVKKPLADDDHLGKIKVNNLVVATCQ